MRSGICKSHGPYTYVCHKCDDALAGPMRTPLGAIAKSTMDRNELLTNALKRLLTAVDPADPEYGTESEAAAIDHAREVLEDE